MPSASSRLTRARWICTNGTAPADGTAPSGTFHPNEDATHEAGTGDEASASVRRHRPGAIVALTAMLWSVLERSDASRPAKGTPNA